MPALPLDDAGPYVAAAYLVFLGLILGLGALVTGSIWARAGWGGGWVWDEPTLGWFLIGCRLYACYQPLRFSIEDPERQANTASVFAIVAARSCR